MKVAFITDYNNHTGIGAQNYSLFVGLKKGGLDIDIINLVSPQGYNKVPNYGINIISNILNNKYLSFGYGVFCKFPKDLKRKLKEGKYTHVILGHQGLAYLGKLLQKWGLKTTIIIHDLFTLYGDKDGMNEFIYNHFLLKGVDKIKNIIFISEFTKKDYERFYGSLHGYNCDVIYQGIDGQKVDGNLREVLIKKYNLKDKKIILNIGSENPRKNIKTFLEVANCFKDRENLLFVRVGRPSPESQTYINENGLKNILYCSGVSDEELIVWYDVAKIVLSTSTLEGYGRQIFEGYLYDNYIVTSNVSDVKKIFKGDKDVFIEDSPYSVESYVKDISDIILLIKKEKQGLSKISNSNDEIGQYLKFLDGI